MKPRSPRSSFLPALAVIALSAPSVFAAIGTFAGTAGDQYWDQDSSNWTGVTGNAWDATNGPNNIALFPASGVTFGGISSLTTVNTNGIIFQSGRAVSGGNAVNLAGSNPFLNVVNAGDTSQFFMDLTGTSGFTKLGAGQIILIGSKGITGGVTVNQGNFRVDNDAGSAASGVLASSNTLTLSGGNLEVTGYTSGTSIQTFGNTSLTAGGTTIKVNPSTGTGTTLSLNNWTSSAKTSLFVDLSSTGTKAVTLKGTIPTLTNSLLGGYATIKDTTGYGFATLDGSNNVVRYTAATVVNAPLGANTVSTTNYQSSTNSTTLFNGTATTQQLNSLDVTSNVTVGGNTAATFEIGAGGVLFSTSNTASRSRVELVLTAGSATNYVLNVAAQTNAASNGGGRIRSIVDNGSNAVSLVIGGPGSILMDTNGGATSFTYSGDTIVNQGSLERIENIPSGAGKGNLVVNSNGTVVLGTTGGATRTINGLANTTAVGGSVNSAGAVRTLDLGNGNATASFSGVISNGSGGTLAITKSGTGTQTFSGANTYSGTTAVNAGKLLVNNTTGSGTGTGAVSVAGTATLGGTGTITPTGANGISVASTGKLAPGDNDTIGALTIDLGTTTGGVTMASGSIFDWQLSGSGGTPDQVNFWNYNSGDLVLNSNAINLKLTGAVAAGSYTATLFKFYSNAGTTLGASGLTSGLSIGSLVGSFSGTPTFDYGTTGEIRLNYTVVPEPTSALAGLLITAGLLRRRRMA